MRAVSVQVAPVCPGSVVAADDAGDLFAFEVRMNGTGIAAVKSGVGYADGHSFSRITYGVGGRDVHERRGLGNVVVYRPNGLLLNVHDCAKIGQFPRKVAGDLRPDERRGLAGEHAFGRAVLFQKLFHFPVGGAGSKYNERGESFPFRHESFAEGAFGLVFGKVLPGVEDLKLRSESLKLLAAAQNMVGVGREKAHDLNAERLHDLELVFIKILGGLKDVLEFTRGSRSAYRFRDRGQGGGLRVDDGLPQPDRSGVGENGEGNKGKQKKERFFHSFISFFCPVEGRISRRRRKATVRVRIRPCRRRPVRRPGALS